MEHAKRTIGDSNKGRAMEFENAEYGIKATVEKIDRGYAVALVDTDANEIVDGIRIYNNEADAVDYARRLVA